MLNFPIRLNDKLSGVYGFAAGGNALPSRQAREVFDVLSAQADRQLDRLKTLLQSSLPALNKLIYERQVPVISVKEKDSEDGEH
jgi:hypothetical protein